MKKVVLVCLAVMPLLAYAQKTDQTIKFGPIPAKTYGNSSFPLTATATSELNVTYTSSNPKVIIIINTVALAVGAGDATITASQPGNASFNAAQAVTQRVLVRKANQSINFQNLGIKKFGDPALRLSDFVNSDQTLVYKSSDPSVAAIEGGNLVIKQAGVVSISVDHAGNSNYLPATTVTRTLFINKASQSISIDVPSTVKYGDQPYTLSPASSSGQPVTLVNQYDSIAEIVNGKLVIKRVGTTTITATIPGTINHLAAQSQWVIKVEKAAQQITFGALPSREIGSPPMPVSATSTSGLPVVFTSLRSGVASVVANTLTPRGIGTAVIVASQPGNENYLPAAEVNQNFVVTGATVDFQLAGFSSEGGANSRGNIFSLSSTGQSFSNKHSFENGVNVLPTNGIIKGSDNKLYGALGNGPLFSMNPDGSGFTIIYSLAQGEGSSVNGHLMEASNGYLYGVTLFGGAGTGVVFRLKKDGNDFSVLKRMSGSGGMYPSGAPIQAADGLIYGTTYQGGANAYGVLYKMNLDGTGYTEIFAFGGATRGNSPQGSLVQGPDGYLYGVTAAGGPNNKGGVFKVKTDGTGFSRIKDFDGAASGETGAGSLIIASDGNLYGMAMRGGANGKGTIFSLSTTGAGFTKLLDFDGTNGSIPACALFEASSGLLYGLTSEGGSANLGVSFNIAKNGTGYTKLIDFIGANGSSPKQGHLFESQPNFFVGTTYTGGNGDVGTIFSVTSSGTYSLIKDFPQMPATPWSMVSGPTHHYGLTIRGGAHGEGNIFRILPDGSGYTSIHDLNGNYLFAERLTYMRDNTIWGVGREGVIAFNYFIFKINADGTNFQRIEMVTSGLRVTALLDYSPEYVYGVSMGTVFRLKRDLTALEKLTDVPGGSGGASPFIPSVLATDGSIFGVASEGGSNNNGVVFKVNTDHVYTKLFDLNSTTGTIPTAVLALNGGVCVATSAGGANNKGRLLTVTENGKHMETIFDFSTETGTKATGMIQSNDSYIYVTTASDGANGKGSIFKILPDGSNYMKLYDFKAGESAGTNSILAQKQTQTLTEFNAIPQKQFLDMPFTLTAVGSSSNPVRFISSNTSVATVEGNLVTIRGVGTTVISAQLAAVGNYIPSNSIERTLTVVKSDQTISFDAIPGKKVGDPEFRLVAAASSGLPLKFTISNMAVATVSHGNVKLLSPGTISITASIEPNPNFNSVDPIQRTLVVDKGNNTITFEPIPTRFIDNTPATFFTYASTPITVVNSDASVATVSGSSFTPIGAGTTNITANSITHPNYTDAAAVTQQLKVLKFDQTIAFDVIPARSIEDAWFIFPGFGSTSGLPVTISTSSDLATLSLDTVKMQKPGRVTIGADQPGNEKFNAALPVSRTFCINPARPVFTVDRTSPERPVLTSNASSGNQWYFNDVPMTGKTGTSITVSESGTYALTVSTDGCESAKSESASYIVTGLAGDIGSVVLYPNPSHDRIFIDLPGNVSAHIIVYDIMGREQQRLTTNETTFEMDIAHLSVGKYVVKVFTGTSILVATFSRISYR